MKDISSNSLISPSISIVDNVFQEPLQLGVMASGTGSNFVAIAKAIEGKQLKAEIKVLIYNNQRAKVKDYAKKYNIPSVLIDHRKYNRREDLDKEIVKTLNEYNVRWVIMAGWMRVVTQVLLDSFPNKVINIHPSLLPSFKGINAIDRALQAGVKITGCTVHFVSLEVDSGDIIIQAAVPVLPNDSFSTLHKRIQVQEHIIYPQAISLLINN